MSEEEKVTCESEETKKTQSEETVEEKIEEIQTDETTETHGEEVKEEQTGEEQTVEETKKENKEETKEDLQDKYLRLMAEYQNYRNRTTKEKSDIYAHANEKMALDVLEVIDNFERAMEQKPEGDKFAEGIELILKQLSQVLEKNNVTVIDAMGKDFDPNFHNAVMTEEVEGAKPGTVTKVFQKGYLLNSKVIRAAMVAVAKE